MDVLDSQEKVRIWVTGFWYTAAGATTQANYQTGAWAFYQEARPRDARRELLGLPAQFTRAQLRQAYRKGVRATHPDAGGRAEDFRRVKAAYESLLREVSG